MPKIETIRAALDKSHTNESKFTEFFGPILGPLWFSKGMLFSDALELKYKQTGLTEGQAKYVAQRELKKLAGENN